MKRFISIIILFLICSNAVMAQQLKGKVFNTSNNEVLAGATVTIANTGTTTSDTEGNFSLPCAAGKELVVSFVGYRSMTQKIKSCDENISIGLTPVGNTLSEIEITASSVTKKSLLYQPSSITKLEPKEIKRGTGLFLDDAINNNVPGVTMNRRAVSSGQQFNIRGYGNGSRGTRGISSNFDGQGYKLYLNGIPVTDAEGITTMDDIDFGSIGNVEVTKGPSGTLYGLAIAGVINLSTIKPEPGKTSLSQEVLVGNYGLQRFTTQFQTATNKSSILTNYGHQQSNGFTIHNASKKDFVNFAGEFKPTEKQTISTYFGYSNSYDQRSGELTIAQYNNNDYSGNIKYIQRDAHSKIYTFRAGASHIYQFNKIVGNTTTIFGTGFNSNASSAGGWTDKASTNLGLRSAFNTKFNFANVTLSGITGIETQRQNATNLSYDMIDPLGKPHENLWKYGDPYFIIGSYTAGNNATKSNLYTGTATTSLFTEWTLGLPKEFSITGGIGFSNMRINLDDRIYVANSPSHYDTSYNGMFSPHFAINKVFNKQFSVYASYNRAYKAPVSNFFYIPFVAVAGPQQSGIVNNKLIAEKADQYEFGTKGALLNSKLIYQLAAFNITYNNKFTSIAVPFDNTTTLYSYVANGGKQVNQGIEALVKYTAYESATGFISNFSPFANLTYSNFEYKDYPVHFITPSKKDSLVNYQGNKVAGVPQIMANLGFDLITRPGIYANMTYLYKDKLPITSDGLLFTGSYSLLNGKMGYRHSLAKHFFLDTYFGVNNITESKYPIMVFVNQLPDAYVAGPGKANYFGGINLKYTF